jgi:hypothetical protein
MLPLSGQRNGMSFLQGVLQLFQFHIQVYQQGLPLDL